MPTYNFNLTADIVLQTVVSSQGSGTNNVATINVNTSNGTIWSAVTIQSSPTVVTPELSIGSGSSETTIAAGSTFTLTVPTSLRNGNMVADVSYTSSPSPTQQYNGQIATWTLTST